MDDFRKIITMFSLTSSYGYISASPQQVCVVAIQLKHACTRIIMLPTVTKSAGTLAIKSSQLLNILMLELTSTGPLLSTYIAFIQELNHWCYFYLTYHTKQLNLWPISSASRVVNYSQLFACEGDMESFEGDSSTHGCLTSHSKSSLGNFHHEYMAELLVNVYSYHVMMKSVS